MKIFRTGKTEKLNIVGAKMTVNLWWLRFLDFLFKLLKIWRDSAEMLTDEVMPESLVTLANFLPHSLTLCWTQTWPNETHRKQNHRLHKYINTRKFKLVRFFSVEMIMSQRELIWRTNSTPLLRHFAYYYRLLLWILMPSALYEFSTCGTLQVTFVMWLFLSVTWLMVI